MLIKRSGNPTSLWAPARRTRNAFIVNTTTAPFIHLSHSPLILDFCLHGRVCTATDDPHWLDEFPGARINSFLCPVEIVCKREETINGY